MNIPFPRIILIMLSIGCLLHGDNTKLNFYGYFDLEAEISDKDPTGKIWTFDQHHLNLISIYQVESCYRLFTEIEWEHGVFLEANGEGAGKVYLTRAWLEYKHSDAFKIQAGKILVPFGIYGIRYDATPTYLSTRLPHSIYGKHVNSAGKNTLLYPKYLTGLQFTGLISLNQWNLNYYLHLTNGRGPNPAERDNNSNKGFGGRVELLSPGRSVNLGSSFYTDKDGNSLNSRQLTYGFDLTASISKFTIETEVVIPRGETVDSIGIRPNDYQDKIGAYIQTSYNLRDRLTPFFRNDFYDPETGAAGDIETILSVGLNHSISSRIYLKAEIHRHYFEINPGQDYSLFITSLSVAF